MNLIEYLEETNTFNKNEIRRILRVRKSIFDKILSGEKELTKWQYKRIIEKVILKKPEEKIVNSIKPIVEFFQIDYKESYSGKYWNILSDDSDDDKINALREELKNRKGIYFFYNSVGKVIYSGKTQSQTLWKEMNLVLNRERTNQKIFIPNHNYRGDFSLASEKDIQIKEKQVFLYDIALYFSAYDIDTKLIHNLEALIIRSIPNNLTNKRIEKFKYNVT
jgi:hypothetical protein